jgi:uncharacterized LabA/DUF88 family protein
MTDRVVIFLDWQNVYRGAREAFCGDGVPHWEGQVHPLALGQLIAADSRFDRQLHQVRVYRGQPDATRDPKGHAANARQVAAWRQSSLVDVTMRTLRYPRGWPDSHQAGEKPQEKGIDVALAIDFVTMAVTGQFEVGVLMSTDTDLKPALEAVARLTDARGVRAEVASWSSPVGRHSRRLSIASRRLYCHWLGQDAYDQIADATSYSETPRRRGKPG